MYNTIAYVPRGIKIVELGTFDAMRCKISLKILLTNVCNIFRV